MSKFTCLIIDDSEDARYVLKRMITSFCKESDIIEKKDGMEAYNFLKNITSKKEKAQQLILFIDINMPIMNGFEFLDAYKELYQSSEDKNLLFMFSSSSDQFDIDKASEYTFVQDYLVKGMISPHALISLKEKYLGNECA